MAVYRPVYTSFWTDSKIRELLTPEDRYFMLYVLTNPLTNTIGCYEIPKIQMSYDTGYTIDIIDKLIERSVNVNKMIMYDKDKSELLITNWSRYNWLQSTATLTRINEELNTVKSDKFKKYLINKINNHYESIIKKQGGVGGASGEPIGDSRNKQEHNTNSNITKHNKKILSSDEHSTSIPFEEIISFLNSKANTNFKNSTEKTKDCIKARFNEGWKLEDFYKVIEIKTKEWLGTDQEIYLRPITLFGTKFESYLNQKSPSKQETTKNRGLSSATTI